LMIKNNKNVVFDDNDVKKNEKYQNFYLNQYF
jgi:hypothetical protein